MPRPRKILLLIACAVVTIVVVAVMLAGPSMQRAFFYPKPRGLPPVVGDTTEQLLARLQTTLETNAPIVAQSMQPGLSNRQISHLEAQGGFRLSDDLRALYRWHNGMGTNSAVGLLPGQRFVPLDEVVASRMRMHQQSGVAFRVFAGHRKQWLHILDDGAGDGYFYDPQRTDAQGSFFLYFGEGAYYVWFPSLRNFLSGVIECYQTRTVKVAQTARVSTRMQAAPKRYGDA